MKPLQRIMVIKQIAKELGQRGFTWDDAFQYLIIYDKNVHYHGDDDYPNLEAYISTQVSSFTDETIAAMAGEISGEIIQNDTFDNTTANADCWRTGYYRMFVSHLTSDKESATNLKRILAKYGIDCFVAHEDIEPSKLWQTEIEKALASMDFLCAIITPNFHESKWCDQEIGIALGRAIPILSIKKGADPHGFIGKYQDVKAKKTADGVAKDVFTTLCNMGNANQKYFTILGKLFLNSNNEDEALTWIKLINKIPSFTNDVFDKMYNSFNANDILNNKTIITEFNKLAIKLGKATMTFSDPEDLDVNILPF